VATRRYWLVKSDPGTFGLAELASSPDQTTRWDGVRNFQARNFLRDEMRPGDGVLFYHSQADPPAVVATARVVRAGYPDPTQFDRRSPGWDSKATSDRPLWYAVDIRLDRPLARPVTLAELRETRASRTWFCCARGAASRCSRHVGRVAYRDRARPEAPVTPARRTAAGDDSTEDTA